MRMHTVGPGKVPPPTTAADAGAIVKLSIAAVKSQGTRKSSTACCWSLHGTTYLAASGTWFNRCNCHKNATVADLGCLFHSPSDLQLGLFIRPSGRYRRTCNRCVRQVKMSKSARLYQVESQVLFSATFVSRKDTMSCRSSEAR